MKFIIKYWMQITGISTALFVVFCWLWNLKTRLDEYVDTQKNISARMGIAETKILEHDETLDEHSDKLIVLDKIEELREKGLLK